jgi:hypothetical protein
MDSVRLTMIAMAVTSFPLMVEKNFMAGISKETTI